MINSRIDWTDHSLNFWIGCKKLREGCANCYMFREQKRYGNDPTNIHRTTKNTWNQVKKFKPGEKVFVCSWSDFFIKEADPWREEAWNIIRNRPDLIWILLTKRIGNVKSRLPEDWGDGWQNVIGMVTAENQKWADHDIPILTDLPFINKGISIEPMLGHTNLRLKDRSSINLVIAGCESGPQKRTTKYCWIKNLKNQCVDASVPFFLKQMEQIVDGIPSEKWGTVAGKKIIKMPVFEGQVWDQFPRINHES